MLKRASYHREYAEDLLNTAGVDEYTGRHNPLTALTHAILGLIDMLEEIPILGMRLQEEDDPESD